MPLRSYVPKIVTVVREGYGLSDMRRDAIAGLTVAIVALPLAMALAIASGTTPDKGLITAVVAGFLISALSGSRVQIGGPTGAFVVVVFNVIHQHGYDGLILATLMAGVILLVAGFAKLGTWVKYMPEPVVTGFTAGIAVLILTSQIKDFFGLAVPEFPADPLGKLTTFWTHRDAVNTEALALSLLALAAILLLRRYVPKWPAFLIVVIAASGAVGVFGLHVETIGTAFGQIPSGLSWPQIPEITLAKLQVLLPSAFTIAFLAGVESLLSAVVADGLTGYRHRSNAELIAQGAANLGSALFGGMPATGAIARTATNIRAGARSPVAGMLHAGFLLIFMLVAAPLTSYIPLASLAAILVVVAWNMSDAPRFLHLMSAPIGDRIVLLLTFGFTIAVDLTVAIQVGVVLAAILFMHRMAAVAGVQHLVSDEPGNDETLLRTNLPPGVEVFQFQGPLFFGVTHRLAEVLTRTGNPPRAIILRMEEVPMIDASGISALADLVRRSQASDTSVIVSGAPPAVQDTMRRMGLLPRVLTAKTFDDAIRTARAGLKPRGA